MAKSRLSLQIIDPEKARVIRLQANLAVAWEKVKTDLVRGVQQWEQSRRKIRRPPWRVRKAAARYVGRRGGCRVFLGSTRNFPGSLPIEAYVQTIAIRS